MSKHFFEPGSIVYYSDEDGWFLLFKILTYDSGNKCLARCYWPLADEPMAENWRRSDLRTSCEEVNMPEEAVVLTSEAVSHEDEMAVANFLRIRTGIESRKTMWKELLAQAEAFDRKQLYEEVVVCCTECASYVKFEARVFQLRGHAFLQLKRYSEAIADLEHALSIDSKHTETLFHCSLAYFQTGNMILAKEKKAQLIEVDPTTEKGQLLEDFFAAM